MSCELSDEEYTSEELSGEVWNPYKFRNDVEYIILLAESRDVYIKFIEEKNYDIGLICDKVCYLTCSITSNLKYSNFLLMIKINNEFNVKCDYLQVLKNIRFDTANKVAINEFLYYIMTYIPDINKNTIIQCITNLESIEYVDNILKLDYDSVYGDCVNNKSNNNNLYKYLASRVSNINLIDAHCFINNFTSYDFFNDLIIHGLDCSKLSLSSSTLIYIYKSIKLENIKFFCETEINKRTYYDIIITYGKDDRNKIDEFIKYCTPIGPIGYDENDIKTLDIINNIGILNDNELLLTLLHSYRYSYF